VAHCATSRKVAGSIPDGAIGTFHCHNPSSRTMALGSVDSSSNRNEYQESFLGGKGGQCVGLTTLPPSCADCFEIWEPQPSGTLRACPGLCRDCLTINLCLYETYWLCSCVMREMLDIVEVMVIICKTGHLQRMWTGNVTALKGQT